jgi:hypothetical protein
VWIQVKRVSRLQYFYSNRSVLARIATEKLKLGNMVIPIAAATMIQRNGYRRDSTRYGIMRMYTIDCIAIHSVDDDDIADHQKVGDAFPTV